MQLGAAPRIVSEKAILRQLSIFRRVPGSFAIPQDLNLGSRPTQPHLTTIFFINTGIGRKKQKSLGFPFAFAKLLDDLRKNGGEGFLEVGVTLLGVGPKLWNRVARIFASASPDSEYIVKLNDIVVVVGCGKQPSYASRRAAEISKSENKRTLVLNVEPHSKAPVDWALQ